MLNAVGFGQAPVSASVSGTSFSVQEGQSVSISSELTVSNPDGDNITEYQFLNSGGDSGRFVVGGTTEAPGQWFEVSAANLGSVSYVGGGGPGTDTLQAEVFDATHGRMVVALHLCRDDDRSDRRHDHARQQQRRL